MRLTDLLLLADGRAPVGAYAHSFGLESAVDAGDVHDVATLSSFLDVRLATAGEVEAAFAAAVGARLSALPAGARIVDVLAEADEELAARIPPAPLRAASRELGRHLLRLAVRAWPSTELVALRGARPEGWLQPVALGVVAARTGCPPLETATLSAYGLASGIASAGIRLLGLDPIEVTATLARLGDAIDAVAVGAAGRATLPFAALPCWSAPLTDVRAEHHVGAAAGRLFAT
jgi:urease accessory protein